MRGILGELFLHLVSVKTVFHQLGKRHVQTGKFFHVIGGEFGYLTPFQ